MNNKKLLWILPIMLLLIMSISSADVTTNNLVWTTFDTADKGLTNQFNDVSGNGNTLYMNTAYPTYDVSSDWNQGADWEFSSAHEGAHYSTGTDDFFFSSPTADRSYYAKFNTESMTNTNMLFSSTTDAGVMHVFYDSDGLLKIRFSDGTNRDVDLTGMTNGVDYTLVITYTLGTCKVYLDGVYKGSSSPGTLKTTDPAGFKVGSWVTGGQLYFDGVIDEVAIWDRTLTGTGCTTIGDTCTGGDVYDLAQLTANPYGSSDSPLTITHVSTTARNSDDNAVENFSTNTIQEIERVEYVFNVTNGNYTTDDWYFNFTAGGSDSCAIGNLQNSVCYNYSTNTWIKYDNDSLTSTFDGTSSLQGDNLITTITEYDESSYLINISVDEHYNPNIRKNYKFVFNYSDTLFQSSATKRIHLNNNVRVEISGFVSTNADQYKLDFRVQPTGTPDNPLDAYVCDSDYTTGDVTTSSDCTLIASKLGSELQDDGTKFRAIFTKTALSSLDNEPKYVVLTTNEVHPNKYYSLKTIKATNLSVNAATYYSTDSGTSWSAQTDDYESEMNNNWFLGSTATFFSGRLIVDNGTNITYKEINQTWDINITAKYAPILSLTNPLDGDSITNTTITNVTFNAVDFNDDELNITVYINDTILVTDLNQSNNYWTWNISGTTAGEYVLSVYAEKISNTSYNVTQESSITLTDIQNFTITASDYWTGEEINTFSIEIAIPYNYSINLSSATGFIYTTRWFDQYTVLYNNSYYPVYSTCINDYTPETVEFLAISNELWCVHKLTESTYNGYTMIYDYSYDDFELIGIGDLKKNTTSSSIITPLISSELVNITIITDDYFNRTYTNLNLSNNLAAEPFQSVIDFTQTELISNNTLSGVTYTIDGTPCTTCYLNEGSHTVISSKSGYYNTTTTLSVVALDNLTFNISGMYDQVINVTAFQYLNNDSINSFSVDFNTTSYNKSYSTTGGFIEIPSIKAGTYNLSITSTDYATNTTLYNSDSSTVDNFSFYLYGFNSLIITYKDALTLTTINNVTNTYFSSTDNDSAYTTNGSTYLNLLQPESYTFLLNSTGYADTYYFLTVINDTYEYLTIYMMANTSDIITVNIVDGAGDDVEGSIVKVLKHDITTNTYSVTSSCITDPDGNCLVSVLKNDGFYKFQAYINDELRKTTEPFIIIADTVRLIVSDEESNLETWNTLRGMDYSLVFNEVTNNFRLDFSDSNSRYVCLRTYRDYGTSITLLNTSCSSGTSHTILHPVTNITGSTYLSKLSVTINGEESVLSSITYTFPRYEMGNSGLIFQILLSLLMALVGFAAAELLFLTLPLSLIIGGFLGLHSISLGFTAPLLIVGIVLMMVVRSR